MITEASEMGTVLGVWGHPDDEAYLSAGLMAGALDGGQPRRLRHRDTGEAGSPTTTLARSRNARRCGRSSWPRASTSWASPSTCGCDYPDGGCDGRRRREAVERLGALIEDVRPDTILTFGPTAGPATTITSRRPVDDPRVSRADPTCRCSTPS